MTLFQRARPSFAADAPATEPRPLSGARSTGDLLRQRREALGLDLNEVSAALRIKPAYLAALEEGRPDRLPGPAYAAGFVRAYGEQLGLDGGEVLRRFRVESAALDAKPDLAFPMPLGERGIPGGSMILTALMLALCGYGAWYYLSGAERSRPERVTEVPIELLAPKEMSAATPHDAAPPKTSAATGHLSPAHDAVTDGQPNPVAAATRSTPVLAVPAGLTPGAPTASPPASAASSETSDAAAAPAPATLGEGAAPGEIAASYGSTDGKARIVLRATADSWIAVRDAHQAVLFTHLLKAGEAYRVPDETGLSMRTGNAGGLEITVDGKPVPAVGPNGAVRRNVALDPEALSAGTAVRN